MMRAVGERATAFSRDRIWLAANFLGAAAYLWLSSRTWREPELRAEKIPNSAGDAAVWSMTALPLLIAFLLANLVWLLRRKEQSRLPLLVAALLWVGVFGVDRLLS
jgi:hypothetical protein